MLGWCGGGQGVGQGGDHGVLAATAEAAALATNSQPVTRRSSAQLGGRGGRAVLGGWCGWGGGAEPHLPDSQALRS
jgi:hypothetical protein